MVSKYIYNQTEIGVASFIIKKNLLPTDGYCFIDKTNGTCLQTWFTITCLNWIDLDGQITNYEFFGL